MPTKRYRFLLFQIHFRQCRWRCCKWLEPTTGQWRWAVFRWNSAIIKLKNCHLLMVITSRHHRRLLTLTSSSDALSSSALNGFQTSLVCDFSKVGGSLCKAKNSGIGGALTRVFLCQWKRTGWCAAELANSINREKSATTLFLRKHSVTGVEKLFVNAAFTEAINKLAANESNAMLRHFYSCIVNPRYKMRATWRLGTVVMRDNWSTQHYASGDHCPSSREV